MANGLQFRSALERLINPTVDLGGGPGTAANAQAIAQLILGGGSAEVGGNQAFGEPISRGLDLGPGRLSLPPGAIGQEQSINLPAGAPPRSAPTPIQPNLQRVLDSAKSIAEGVAPGSTRERRTLIANPFGPGSFDPDDPAQVKQIQEQATIQKRIEGARDLLQGISASNLPQAAQGQLIQQILRQAGIVPSEAQETFEKERAKALGKASVEGTGEPLGIEKASKLFKFNRETGQFETPPPNISDREAQEQGFRIFTGKQRETVSEVALAQQAFDQLVLNKKAADQAASESPFGFLVNVADKVSGGRLGGQGVEFDKARIQFTTAFDGLIGGVRGAASPLLTKIRLEVLPKLFTETETSDELLRQMGELVDTLADSRVNSALGVPKGKEGQEQLKGRAQAVLDAAGIGAKSTRREQILGQQLDRASAARILQEAGGDPERARQLARERGFKF